MTDPLWINTRRGSIPKRLVEAWVGRAVGQVLPDAQLWATNFREADGIGFQPQPGTILLQCSWAGPGRRGISTRVRKDTVFAFERNEALLEWRSRAYFVLVGSQDPFRPAEPGSPVALWVALVDELARFIHQQGKGTITQDGFAELARAGAMPLPDLLNELAEQPRAGDALRPRAPRPAFAAADRRYGIDFGAPAPLAITVPILAP